MPRFLIFRTSFRLLAPLINGFLIYLLMLLINNNLGQLAEAYATQELYLTIAICLGVLEINRMVVKVLQPQNQPWALPLQVGIGLGLGLVLVTGGMSAYFNWVVGYSIAPAELLTLGVLFGVMILLYHVLHISQTYLYKENTQLLENEQKIQQSLEWELSEFSQEINSTLLFESLETLITKVRAGKDQAEELIDSLAGVYRYTLSHRKSELVPLEEEIRACKALLQLLNARYNGLIRLHLDDSLSQLPFCLVPGTLPMLVESIARQSIISPTTPLEITAYTEGGEYLILQHSLNERLIPESEPDRVVERLQRSYSFFSELPLVQVKAYEENYIKLPLVAHPLIESSTP
jgi:hypothetical protein